ncbi:thiamine pyrophosphate-binding protein [Chloroflexota bacterium]
MAELTGGQFVARILKEEGVEFAAGVHGGHIWGLLQPIFGEQGIRMIHCRHEQSGAYIADGWGRVTGLPGVCFGTAGPGLFNMVSGLSHAYLCRSPVVALVGQHGTLEDGRTPFQEGYAEDTCKSFTKWTKRIVHIGQISYFVQRAFRDAAAYPPGPVVIELPTNIIGQKADENAQPGYLPKENYAEPKEGGGDSVTVEKVVRMLLEAERPIIIGGDGIHYSKAQDELKEFVELLRIPVHTRRMGRGSVPEDHPLAFTGAYRRPILNNADVIAIFGLRMGFLEHFGDPPTYSHKARYILVSESRDDLDARVPAEVRLLADPKIVLKQMIDCAKDLMKKPPERKEWLDEVTKAKEAAQEATREQVEGVRNNHPIHPHFLAQEVVNVADNDATFILDGYTLAGFSTDKIVARFSGQILDSGTQGGVGHGVGMGIGAQLARPGKQVVPLLGDGGIGVTGFDVETAARNNLPIVYVLFNNSGWMSLQRQKEALPIKDSWGMLPDIRYDEIFERMGCHGEFVTQPEQMRPALERAFNSGKTSVINIIPDDRPTAPQTFARIREVTGREVRE